MGEKDSVETRSPRRRSGPPSAGAGRKVLKALSSVKLAVSLLAVIGAVLIVATVMKDQRQAGRYIYHSWWFISLLGLFCLNLVLCTAGRWSFKVRKLGTTMTHAGVLVMVIGVVVSSISGERGLMQLYIGHSDNSCYARYTWDGAWYEREEEAKEKKAEYESNNLHVELYEEEGKYLLYTMRVVKLPFTVHLQDFWVERYKVLVVELAERGPVGTFPVRVGRTFRIADTPYSVTVLRYEPDFVVLGEGIYGSRSDAPRNPAIQVRVENGSERSTRWVFAKFPGMHQDPKSSIRLFYKLTGRIKAYKSKVQLFESGRRVASKMIEVNKPLKYKGYCIYQSSYDREREMYSVFEIARDPGIGFVYLGFLIISAGVVFTFYFRPLLLKRRS